MKILISGAGIAGLALARLFKKANIPYMLIEKREHLSTDGAGIALPANAIKAMRYLGLSGEVERLGHQVERVIFADYAGKILHDSSLLNEPLNLDKFMAMPRNTLHDILRPVIDQEIHFNTSIQNIHQREEGVQVIFNNHKFPDEMFTAVIGADGINSAVRQLAFEAPPLNDLGITIWRWISQFPTEKLQPTYFLGLRDFFMVYPISAQDVYCYAHICDPEHEYEKLTKPAAFLKGYYAHYAGLVKTFVNDLTDQTPIIVSRMKTVPKPIFANGRVVLIGDAGHACSPMLQQGAASALEDAITLVEFIKHFPIKKAFSMYESFRKERVSSITTASDNTMRSILNLDSDQFCQIQNNIRQNGPLNIQNWRKLLVRDPISEMKNFEVFRSLTH